MKRLFTGLRSRQAENAPARSSVIALLILLSTACSSFERANEPATMYQAQTMELIRVRQVEKDRLLRVSYRGRSVLLRRVSAEKTEYRNPYFTGDGCQFWMGEPFAVLQTPEGERLALVPR